MYDHLHNKKPIARWSKRIEDYFSPWDAKPPDTWVGLSAFLWQGVRKLKEEVPESEWIIRLDDHKAPIPPEARWTIYDALHEIYAILNHDRLVTLGQLEGTLHQFQQMVQAGDIPPNDLSWLEETLDQTKDRFFQQVEGTADWFLENFFRLTINPEELADLERMGLLEDFPNALLEGRPWQDDTTETKEPQRSPS
jgi:hypothetical protein